MKGLAENNRFGLDNQQGAALIVALILLVVLTLLAVTGMQGTTLQERMSSNLYDRALGMQSSETALRAAEAAISASATPTGTVDCRPETNTQCGVYPANAFTGSAGWQDIPDAFLRNAAIAAGRPQYHIQLMFEGSSEDELGQTSSANVAQYGVSGGTPQARFYRITARTYDPTVAGTDGRGFVVLSATVRRQM